MGTERVVGDGVLQALLVDHQNRGRSSVTPTGLALIDEAMEESRGMGRGLTAEVLEPILRR